MKIIQKVFRKEQGITKHDVESLVGKVQEMSYIECKLVRKEIDTNKEETIIKPIVGFLNKIDDTGGLLILGAQAKNEVIDRIEPFPFALLTQGQVSNIVRDSVIPIPNNLASYMVDVIKVDCDNSTQVLLVEVSKNETGVFYYSRTTNSSYERKGQSTFRLEISELFKRVESARTAKLVIILKLESTTEEPNPKMFRINFYLTNQGTLPGKYITGIIKLPYLKENIIKSGDIRSEGMQDVSSLNQEVLKAFQFSAGNPPNTSFIYPGINFNVGSLVIDSDPVNQNVVIRIESFVHEERTFTKQVTTLTLGQTIGINFEPPVFSNYV